MPKQAHDERYEEDESPRGGRSFWSGTITFGLVSVPVELYPANRSQRASLRMLDTDGTPLRREYYDPETERAIAADALVRGFEMDDGSFVVVTDDELEALEPRKTRDIDLRLFVPTDQLDPLYFERAYFLTPSGDSNKAYRLLAAVMERTGRAGIATFVMRTKEYLIAILAEDGILRAETLRFHDEVRTADELELPTPEAADTSVRRIRRELGTLKRKALAEDELKDAYTERLRKLVERKRRKGIDVVEAPGEVEADADDSIIDLMEVLRRSMRAVDDREARGKAPAGRKRARKGGARKGAAREAGAAGSGATKRASPGGRAASAPRKRAAKSGVRDRGRQRRGGRDLASLSKAELYERARERDVEGRSAMSKAELVRALRDA